MPRPVHEHLHDRRELETFLALDPALHVYALGDLDPAYWPWTSWYGLRRDGDLRELVLCYTALFQPAVMAFVQHSAADMAALLEAISTVLPRRFHAHLDLGVVRAARQHWDLQPFGAMKKMTLRDLPSSADSATFTPLDQRHAPQVRALLDAAYPGNFFEPRMLDTDGYLGHFEGDSLHAVAGLHVLSPSFGAAALGNVAVHPEHRGRGLGRSITHALCTQLRARGVEQVGLNVRADNTAAVSLYHSLGFEVVRDYLEALAVHKE